jgi:hypothetical protein
MIAKIRNSVFSRVILVVLSLNFLLPLDSWAITGGPSQPEFTSFTPVETTDMVDLFTGDFQYNIPLLDVDGYPVNISYSSAGIGMEDQASCVGLGWTLNAGGIINRAVRGIPDDFNGEDIITTTTNLKPNWTLGVNFGIGVEPVGFPVELGAGFGLFYNNYSGPGFETNQSVSISAGDKMKVGGTLNLGYNSESGYNISPALSLGPATDKKYSSEAGSVSIGSGSVGLDYNSRSGLRNVTIGSPVHASLAAFAKTTDQFSIPVGMQTYVPQINNPMNAFSVSADFGLGGEIFWVTGKGKIGGYYNRQSLSNPVKQSPAYGYLYSSEGQNNAYAMHDFNREKESAFNKYQPSLPMAQMTYDIYTATGQGLSGMYRPFRDVGTVYDPYTYQSSTSGSIGGDVGFGGYFKVGLNLSYGYTVTTSGLWSDGSNETRNYLSFRGYDSSKPTYEPVYFKNAGDFSVIDNDYFEKTLQGIYPVRIPENKDKAEARYKKLQVLSNFSETNANIVYNKRENREKRNQTFSYLTVDQAALAALDKKNVVPAGHLGRKKHHISEITINRPDGTRYVFGSQTYNLRQDEVTFNVNVNGNYDDVRNKGLVSYSPGKDNSTNNDKGLDNYYNNNQLPSYATGYQLTAIVSPDYVDVTGNGPSSDDLGTYTKFNYATYASNYKWRNPYGQNSANFSEGYKFRKNDDKGTYLYGEKEIKTLKSIETKNYIAIFTYSNRNDAFEVKDVNGGINTSGNSMPKLDKIELYSKYEYGKPNAKALKVVHFEYDYSLCQGIPSYSDGTGARKGKLTLKKIYFTYGASEKGMLSPYIFSYDETDKNHNPDYKEHNQDRWGTYKPYNVNPANMSNIDYPYVSQNATTDQYAAAWTLKKIQLPSGGEIAVDYESDDYSFVQDKRATSMINVLGLAKDVNSIPNNGGNKLYNAKNNNNRYVYFNAPATDYNDFRRKYFGESKEPIYYKFYVNLTTKGDESYIVGYADYNNIGWKNGIGWIELKEEDGRNPIAKAAMQFVNVNAPDLYYGGNNDNDYKDAGEAAMRKMVGQLDDMLAMITGVYDAMTTKNLCKTIDPNKSFLRLKTPDAHKRGGGVRVKQLGINDNWADMTGPDNKVKSYKYGQKYDYTLTTEYNQDGIPAGTEISSGVAVYEPIVGGDENPLHNPKSYTEKHSMAQDNQFYQERPYGESFFPSASVGYSRVVVTNLANDIVKRTATGHTEHCFYTAKDFPVIIRQDPYMKYDKSNALSNAILKILNFNVKDFMTATQSYAIELNDMHGKPKSQKVYAEGQSVPISSVEYFYKREPLNPKQLSNKILAIDKNAKTQNSLGGINVDLAMDEREWWSYNTSGSAETNVDVSPIIFGIPLPIPSLWPGIHTEETRFRSLTSTKIITRYGILEKKVTQDLGSYTTTDNLGWDAETGEVLLTRTQNNFNDPIYSFTYPAHWGYDGMAPAYKNIGLRGHFNLGGFISNPQAFKEGDELLVYGSSDTIGWVTNVNESARRITVANRNGEKIEGTHDVLLRRSGYRNRQSEPIGTVTSLTNPIVGGQLNFANARVLNAGAVEFNSKWSGNICEKPALSNTTNPYITGEEGNYRPQRSWAYLTGRTQSNENRNTNTRVDGVFTSFSPFWNPTGGFQWKTDSTNWTFASEVTLFSPYGFELENRDALGRYTGATYGYNNTLPTAVSANARYKEMGFAGFEDVKMDNPDGHFQFTGGSVEYGNAHTGRYSIRVTPRETVTIEKDLVTCDQIKK